jgi:hypothetical protein
MASQSWMVTASHATRLGFLPPEAMRFSRFSAAVSAVMGRGWTVVAIETLARRVGENQPRSPVKVQPSCHGSGRRTFQPL